MDEESEEQQPCVICNSHHEQMLMLSCVHDPCINCAAKHYVETQPEDSIIYTCSNCGEETELDESSVIELRKIYNANKRRRKIEVRNNATLSAQQKSSPLKEQKNRRNQHDPQQGKRVVGRENIEQPPQQQQKKSISPTPQQTNYPPNPKRGNYGLQYPCRDHSEEELTYFCFSCSRPICPECAIHGLHKDHQVETTRKAIKKIRGLLAQDKQKLDGEAKGLLESREKGKRQGKALTEQNRSEQEYIKKKMTHLRNILTEKEKELLKAAEGSYERNMERVRHEEVLADAVLSEIMGIHRNIDATLKKEDLAILQEYSVRGQEVNGVLEKSQINRDTVLEYQEMNPLRSVNLILMDENIDRLSSEIYSLKLATVTSKQTYN